MSTSLDRKWNSWRAVLRVDPFWRVRKSFAIGIIHNSTDWMIHINYYSHRYSSHWPKNRSSSRNCQQNRRWQSSVSANLFQDCLAVCRAKSLAIRGSGRINWCGHANWSNPLPWRPTCGTCVGSSWNPARHLHGHWGFLVAQEHNLIIFFVIGFIPFAASSAWCANGGGQKGGEGGKAREGRSSDG